MKQAGSAITSSCTVAERLHDALCLSVVSFMKQYVECNLLLLVTLASDVPLRKLNYVLFSSAHSLVRGFLCHKQTCTVTVCDTPLNGPLSVDTTSYSRHRSIARYRPTIVLIAAGRSSVHSMRWSQILDQNPDFSLPVTFGRLAGRDYWPSCGIVTV